MSIRWEKPSQAVSPSNGTEAIPLTALRAGERGVVARVSGGRGLLGRMTALGFTPGAEVEMLQNLGHGPLLVRVRNARVALGRGEAGRVWVRRKGA